MGREGGTMLKFMLVSPNADEIVQFKTVSWTRANRKAKEILQVNADPEFYGETRAHLYIANGSVWQFVKTLWIQFANVQPDEIERYAHISTEF